MIILVHARPHQSLSHLLITLISQKSTTGSAKDTDVVNDTVYPSANSEDFSEDSKESVSWDSEIEYENDSDTEICLIMTMKLQIGDNHYSRGEHISSHRTFLVTL